MFILYLTAVFTGRLATMSLRRSASRSEVRSSTSAQQTSSCHTLDGMVTRAQQARSTAMSVSLICTTMSEYTQAISILMMLKKLIELEMDNLFSVACSFSLR